MHKPVIYQLLPRLFGNKQRARRPWGTAAENGVGKFADITEPALNAIREFGASHVWYTGILDHATVTDYSEHGIPRDFPEIVKGRAGSPYAVRNNYDVAPDLAVDVPQRMQEFESLVTRTHRCGLKVIIDFVPNHVARAYRSHPMPKNVSAFGANDDPTVAFHRDNNFYYLPGQAFKAPDDYVPLGGMSPPRPGRYHEYPARASGDNADTASPPIHSWFDTVKLNYGLNLFGDGASHFDPIPDTWLKMRDVLLFWTQKKVDGFRCDMAEMIPVPFWGWVIPQIRAVNGDILFIAEIYTPKLYRTYIEEAGFDYLYDKVLLYDALREIISNQSGTGAIDDIQRQVAGLGGQLLHFMENHDEQRIASPFFAGSPWRAIPAMVVSATVDSGPVLIYFGQEVGEPASGASGFSSDDGRTSIFDYWHVPEHQRWMNDGRFDGALLSMDQRNLRRVYRTLLQLCSMPAIAEGNYLGLVSKQESTSTHAYIRYTANERLLVVSNFNDREESVDLVVDDDNLETVGLTGPIRLRGIFGTESLHSIINGHCSISLGAWQANVYSMEQ